jgi:hypothetical protein
VTVAAIRDGDCCVGLCVVGKMGICLYLNQRSNNPVFYLAQLQRRIFSVQSNLVCGKSSGMWVCSCQGFLLLFKRWEDA